MQETKFRVWDLEDKRWLKKTLSYQIMIDSGGIVYKVMFNEIENIPNVVVQYFTGIKDKNGVDIYEGDIIYIADNWTDEIKFIDGIFGINWLDDFGGVQFTPLAYLTELKIERIGNIFENPKLLNQK